FFVQIKAQVCVADIVLHGLSPPFIVLIDSAGCTGVVLLCCEISIRKSEEKGIEGKLSWN
ncbi:MAG: hypothetical protein WAX15_10355, partial [Blautia wexlerae]